jgi:hypothetical protein
MKSEIVIQNNQTQESGERFKEEAWGKDKPFLKSSAKHNKLCFPTSLLKNRRQGQSEST